MKQLRKNLKISFDQRVVKAEKQLKNRLAKHGK